MQHELENGDHREEDAQLLRNDAEILENEALGMAAAASVLEAEAGRLEHGERIIHFKVDGEPYETQRPMLTADQILAIAGLDPTLRYLEEISPDKASFKDRGQTDVRMVNHVEFISLSVGPTPTS